MGIRQKFAVPISPCYVKIEPPGRLEAHFYAIFHEKFVKNRTFLALFREFSNKNCSYKYEQF